MLKLARGHTAVHSVTPRGGGGTLIFLYTYAWVIFWVQNFEFQFSRGFHTNLNIFLSMKILWIFLGGHHKIGLYLGVISMHFRVFP